RFGIPYQAPFGHRGASHSLLVAVAVGILWGAATRFPCKSLWRSITVAALVVASHGLLDTLTDGGLGAALLWPFSDHRFFAPWRPIPVAPIGRGFLSMRGLRVAAAELIMFAPLFVYGLWPRRGPR